MPRTPSGPLRIGLSANIYQPDLGRLAYKGRRLLFMEEGMFHWVLASGALALLLPTLPPPPLSGKAKGSLRSQAAALSVDDLVSGLDGIIMTGGVDMAPESYGETPLRPEWAGDKHRDDYEIAIVRAALAQAKPILGICRGHQVLNVALGGTLFQDIRTQNAGALHHRIYDVYEGNNHAVQLEKKSKLAQLFGVQTGSINSVHHQAIKDLAAPLAVEARSPEDGIVEAVRLKGKSDGFLLGVQWHPELQAAGDKTLLSPLPILTEFLAAARLRRG